MSNTPTINVLLVEDDPIDLRAVRKLLTEVDDVHVETEHVGSLTAAIERLSQPHEFHAVLLDLGLPESTGLATLDTFHASAGGLPVIVLASADDHRTAVDAVQRGAQDYLVKGAVTADLVVRPIRYAIERHRLQRELASQEQRLSAIIRNSADGIVVVDQTGTVQLVNPAAEALLGRTSEELLGNVFGFPVGSGTSELEIEVIRSVDGRQECITAEMRVAEGEWQNQPVYFASLRDVSDRKRLTEELARSNRDLEQFAYAVSHDLKAPLRGVTSFGSLLRNKCKNQLDEQGEHFLQIMLDSAARMQVLIDDLLSYAQVKPDEQPRPPIDFGAALDEALANVAEAVKASGAVVTHDVLPTLPGNQSQISRLFQNLLDNALKFRRSDTAPQIHVSASQQGGEWQFGVRDNGIGIAPEQGARIFVVFQRLHTQSEYEGTGIGLALCKRIVENHGGRIRVESEPGQGSTFLFTVPGEITRL